MGNFFCVIVVGVSLGLLPANAQTLAGKNAASKVAGPVVYYYHADHLGSSSTLTDSSGSKIQHLIYHPFGKERSLLDSANFLPVHRFTGQVKDDETGLNYYNARYYDANLGRFIQADTIVPQPENPQALNRYSYVVNNPLKFNDPSGHVFQDPSANTPFFDDPGFASILSGISPKMEFIHPHQTPRQHFREFYLGLLKKMGGGDEMSETDREAFAVMTIMYDATDAVLGPFILPESDTDALLVGLQFYAPVPAAASASTRFRAPSKAGSNIREIEIVYRGTGGNPGEIFSSGFRAPGSNSNLLQHLGRRSRDTAYVSTSTSFDQAAGWAVGRGEQYVYAVRRPPEGIDINWALRKKSPFGVEREIAVLNQISTEHIYGAYKIGTFDWEKRSFPILEFILNPNFSPR